MSATTLERPAKPRKTLPELLRLKLRFLPKFGLSRKIIHLWDGIEGAAYRVNYYDKAKQTFPESYFVLVTGPMKEDMEVWNECIEAM